MIKLRVLEEQDPLLDSLKKIISGMLPHDNFEPKLFGSVLNKMLTLIHLEELTMEYYVLTWVLQDLRKLQIAVDGFEPKLSRKALESVLESTIYNLAKDPYAGLSNWMQANMMDSNLENEEDLAKGTVKLFQRTMDLYDECLELEVSPTDTVIEFISASNHLLAHVSESCMDMQGQVLRGNYRYERKVYAGPQGWLELTGRVIQVYKDRIKEVKMQSIKLNNASQLDEMMKSIQIMFKKQFDTGITPWDESTGMLMHRLITIAANEGVGKTALACFLAAVSVMEGVRVVYMVGETKPAMIYTRVVSAYLFVKHGKFVPTSDIANLDFIEDLDKQRLIRVAMLEIIESGLLELVPAFGYYTVEEELEALYEEDPFGVVILDHTLALTGGKNMYEDIGALSVGLRNFKNNRPVSVVVLSHLSVTAKELVKRGKEIDTSPTKGNSSLSSESDEVFVLSQNKKMEEQGLLCVDNSKTRGKHIKSMFMLRIVPECNSISYDVEDQVLIDENTMSADAALDALDRWNQDEIA